MEKRQNQKIMRVFLNRHFSEKIKQCLFPLNSLHPLVVVFTEEVFMEEGSFINYLIYVSLLLFTLLVETMPFM